MFLDNHLHTILSNHRCNSFAISSVKVWNCNCMQFNCIKRKNLHSSMLKMYRIAISCFKMAYYNCKCENNIIPKYFFLYNNIFCNVAMNRRFSSSSKTKLKKELMSHSKSVPRFSCFQIPFWNLIIYWMDT